MMMSFPVVGTVMIPTSVVSVMNRRGTEACSDHQIFTRESLTCDGETVPVLGENTYLPIILTLLGGNPDFSNMLPISFKKITACG